MMAPSHNRLKLLATDAEELTLVSAAIQDAITHPSDMVYRARSRSFGFECNRFCWETASGSGPYFRSRALVAVGGVLEASFKGMSRASTAPLVVLGLQFNAIDDQPEGHLEILLSGTSKIRLHVECVDLTLIDRSDPWPTRRRPRHGVDQ